MDILFEAISESVVEFRWWRRLVFLACLAALVYFGATSVRLYGVWFALFILFEALGWLSAPKSP